MDKRPLVPSNGDLGIIQRTETEKLSSVGKTTDHERMSRKGQMRILENNTVAHQRGRRGAKGNGEFRKPVGRE